MPQGSEIFWIFLGVVIFFKMSGRRPKESKEKGTPSSREAEVRAEIQRLKQRRKSQTCPIQEAQRKPSFYPSQKPSPKDSPIVSHFSSGSREKSQGNGCRGTYIFRKNPRAAFVAKMVLDSPPGLRR
ncbi:MAG: hypothetical protein LBR62_03350 [Puniceicoccales bacterium]|jgi:hypothetical protein|nr:hypothetical protein [Puniceicoccales bacterium]